MERRKGGIMKATIEMINKAKADKAHYIDVCHRNDNIENKVSYAVISRSDCQSDLDWIARNNIHLAIARKALKTLFFNTGSEAAFDILNGYNKTVSIEDIAHEVYCSIAEQYTSGNITVSDDTMIFADDTSKKTVFGTVSAYLYSMQVRHYKRAYISLDDDTIVRDTIPTLQSYETEERLNDSPFWLSFCGHIRKMDNKNANDIIHILEGRIIGLKVSELNISVRRYQYCMKLAKALYASYNATEA